MNKLVVVAFILGLSGIGAQAMPLASVQTPDGMIIKVKDGCGPGFYLHRTVHEGLVIFASRAPFAGSARFRPFVEAGREFNERL
jgi:hypothetical protein